MIPFTPGSLVAAYFRDSGGDTQELSIPQQEQAFREWCLRANLTVGAIFKDAARPGSSTITRTGFLDMMHHFRYGHAPEAGLVIWSYSRFARDFDDAQFYRADLRRRGFIFYSLNDDIPDGPMGRFFEAAIDWKNEQFLQDLSRDVKRGLTDLVANHGCIPGTPPRGFIRQPMVLGKRRDGQEHIAHRWAPDPQVVPLVVLAFTMRASGSSIADIHNYTHLYSSYNSYSTFFSNRIYIGILDYGDQSIQYCAPIIPLDTWKAVQDRQTTHSQLNHPRRIHSTYPLSGLVFCARCGSPLFGQTSPQRSKTSYQRYACTRAKRRHDCDLQAIPRKVLDDAVIKSVTGYILSEDIQQYNQDYIVEHQARIQHELKDQKSALQTQLTAARKRINNLTSAIEEAGHSKTLLDRLSALEGESNLLQSQIDTLDRQVSAAMPAGDQVDLDHLKIVIETSDLPTLQIILRGIISRITVDRDGPLVTGSIIYFHPP